MLRAVLASATVIALAAGSARADGPGEGPGSGASNPDWRAATGLRAEQWMAPRSGGMGLDVRLTLPEMEHASFAVETFSWERLDVMEEDLDPDAGTVYQVLGLRRWFGGPRAAVFAGAHVMTYADGPRGFTPWFGFRLGRAQGGPTLAAEVRLTGMGVIGWRGGGIDSGELGVKATGPSLGRFRLGGRARLRSVHEVQRDATISAGIETTWRDRPLFVGLGLQTLERTPPDSAPPDPQLMMMETADSAPRPTSALMLQLEVDMDLPRSIAE
jgi:hypothetical protein